MLQNHTLSDDTDKILTLQGVGWAKRKIINNATITLHIKHYTDNQSAEHIDIEQTLTGGITASPELRTLDWTWREVDHSIFGATIGRSRRIPLADVTDEYLKSGWVPDVSRDGAIQVYAESDKKNPHTWKSDMVSKFSPYLGTSRDTTCVDVMMQHRSGVSRMSKTSVAIPEGSGSQARKVKTLRLVSSMIMVCHWPPWLPRVSLNPTSWARLRSDKVLNIVRLNLPTSTDVGAHLGSLYVSHLSARNQ
jgi:hypothetical protein